MARKCWDFPQVITFLYKFTYKYANKNKISTKYIIIIKSHNLYENIETSMKLV